MLKRTNTNSSNLLILKILKRIGLFVFNIILLTIIFSSQGRSLPTFLTPDGSSSSRSFFSLSPNVAHAAPNYQLNYQGKLTNASNVAVSDGSYNIRFRLCTDSSCSSVIYTETHCYSPDNGTTCDGTGTDQRVTLTNGLFSTMIGSVVSTLSSLNFNQTLYLGVTVGGSDATPSWDPEMSPRKTLGTVPSSFEAYHSLSSDTATNATNASNSDTLDTYHESSFAFLSGRSGGQTLIGGSSSNNTLILQGTSNGSNTSTNANIQLKVGDSGGTTAMTILNNGNVGIGDTSPDTILDILSSQASNTELTITNTNVGSYSPQIGLSVSEGTNSFTLGVDDNDSQKFKISTTALGTNDILTIDSRTTTSGVSTATIQGSSATIASASNSKLTTLTITPPTLTLTGTTQVTSQMDSTLINAPTITDNDAVTVDKAATLTIAGAPIKGGSVTLSNTYALKINSQAVSTASTSYSLFVDAQTGATNNYAAVFNTGNVGIGTTTPQALLDVNGNILVSGSSRYINFDTTSGSSGYGFRDNSGTMEFKNSGGAWATFPATLSWTSQEFSTPGTATWTKPAGVSNVLVLCVGGGGGGGASNNSAAGAGGGAGEVRQDFVTVTGDVTVTIGSAGSAGSGFGGNGTNGGDSSFGALLVAAGGKFGYGASGTTTGGIGGRGGGASGSAGVGGVPGTAGSNAVTGLLGANLNPGIVSAGGSGGGGGNNSGAIGGMGGSSGTYAGGSGGSTGGSSAGGGGGGGGGYGNTGGAGGSGGSNSAQAGQGYGAGGGGGGGYAGGSYYAGAAGYKGYCKVWWQE